MAKSVSNRYASMADLAAVLADQLRGKTESPNAVQTQKPDRRPYPTPSSPLPVHQQSTEAYRPGISVGDLGGLRSVAQLANTPVKKARAKPPRRRARASKKRRGLGWIIVGTAAGIAAILMIAAGSLILWHFAEDSSNRIEGTKPANGLGLNAEPAKPAGMGEEVRQIHWPKSNIYAVSISPDGRYYLANGDSDKTRVWSIETGLQVREVRGFLSTFTSDAAKLLVVSRHRSEFSVYQTGSWQLRNEGTGGDDLDNLWLVPRTDEFVTATKSGYDLWTLKGEHRYHWLCDPARSDVVFSQDGRHMLLRLDGNPWHAVDVATITAASGFEAITDIGGLRGFTSDGKQAFALRANKLHFFDVKTGTDVKTVTFKDLGVTGLTLSADDKRVLTANNDDTVRLWDIATGNELCRFFTPGLGRPRGKAIAISADGRYACAGGSPGTVYLWRLP
jgi:WD40 repeat protein